MISGEGGGSAARCSRRACLGYSEAGGACGLAHAGRGSAVVVVLNPRHRVGRGLSSSLLINRGKALHAKTGSPWLQVGILRRSDQESGAHGLRRLKAQPPAPTAEKALPYQVAVR